MNNLEKAIERLSDLLDEMVDKMDVDASGDPDDAMRWATQLSDALVRLRRHAKADTKTGVDLCQATPPAAVPEGCAIIDLDDLRAILTARERGFDINYIEGYVGDLIVAASRQEVGSELYA